MSKVQFCPDCELDGIIPRPETIFDAKHGGDVCPRCHRVFMPGQNMKNFHYTEKKFMIAKMRKDMRVRKLHDTIEAAVRQRWMKDDGFAVKSRR